jgi:hypothetical protein
VEFIEVATDRRLPSPPSSWLPALLVLGMDQTDLPITVVAVLMLFVLQSTQTWDSAALSLKNSCREGRPCA